MARELIAQARGLLEALGARPPPPCGRAAARVSSRFLALEQQHGLRAGARSYAARSTGSTHGPRQRLIWYSRHGRAAVAEHRVAAGAQREDLADGVERLAHGRRAVERPEVAAAVLDDAPRDQHARPRSLHRDLDADVALVVLQPDVVARLVLLDQVVLEDQRFLLVRRDQRLEVGEPADQEAHLAALVAAAEVAAHARAQALRLADVDDLPVRVLQQVHAGPRRRRRARPRRAASLERRSRPSRGVSTRRAARVRGTAAPSRRRPSQRAPRATPTARCSSCADLGRAARPRARTRAPRRPRASPRGASRDAARRASPASSTSPSSALGARIGTVDVVAPRTPRRAASAIAFWIVCGVMPCSRLYACWIVAPPVGLVDRAAASSRSSCRRT